MLTFEDTTLLEKNMNVPIGWPNNELLQIIYTRFGATVLIFIIVFP